MLFAVHDLLKDPPFSHIDLISCRNVLIYLDRELQEQVYQHISLRAQSGGYLFLGSSETGGQSAGLVPHLDRTARIYPVDRGPRRQAAAAAAPARPVRMREQVLSSAGR